jgi:uracil-DNA glycosylase
VRCRSNKPTGTFNSIAFVGGAAGEQENFTGAPFMGASGQELTRLLMDAGIQRRESFLTYVFMDRPLNDKLSNWCVNKAHAAARYIQHRKVLCETWPDFNWPKDYSWSSLGSGEYLLPEYLGELPRLKQELEECQANVIVPLGAVACWALLQTTGIKFLRGVAQPAVLVPGAKVLPTFNPGYILRRWEDRPIMLADLLKIKRNAAYPEVRLPKRELWIEPTLQDLYTFEQKYLADAELISCDIENTGDFITCIGFAPNPSIAIVVPFVDHSKPDYHYWPTLREETLAWEWVRRQLVCETPKLGQNFLYDMQHLWKGHGIPIMNFQHDTMLLHHAQYPELQKGLGFLASIHTDESAWKLLRQRGEDEEKRDA